MSNPAPEGAAAPAGYRPETPWSPAAALLVVLVASLAPVPIAMGFLSAQHAGLVPAGGPHTLASPLVVGQMMLGQLASFAVVWAAAGWRGARAATLRLAPDQETGWLTAAGYGVLLIVAIGPIELLLYRLFGVELFADGRWLLEGLTSPHGWAVALAAVVLAPLWEEATFRGFLLSSLAKTRLGFWPSAILTSCIWTALHAGYSWPGLGSVFLAGIGLSWIMLRTGSLKAVVIAHAVINAFSLTLILLFAR
jgi:membrane protease YdiL (CAAX protease family)